MKPGDVVLIRFPEANLRIGKLRPALIVATVPGRHSDLLLALITSQLGQAIPDFDEIIYQSDVDFPASGLKIDSVVRIARLATVNQKVISARLGSISTERLDVIHERIAKWVNPD